MSARKTCFPSSLHRVSGTVALVATMFAWARAEESIHVDEMVVVLIDAVNVPSSQSGVIAEIVVREGKSVTSGTELARLDDRRVQLEQSLATTQLAIAAEQADDELAVELAKKKLAQEAQLGKQQAIARDIATRKSKNEVRILASKKAEGVAKNELDRATRARQEYIDSVSRSEIDGLRLAYERTRLETEQADFERQLDVLHAKAEDEAAVAQALSVDRSRIEVEQAIAQQRVQRLQMELEQHQSELAKLATLQHSIMAPIDGVVVERFCNKGDWVNAGDPVIRVIRLNRLRAEGFIPAGMINRLRDNRTVQLQIQISPDETVQREGQVVFISPEIDPVNNEVRFWVEFDNPSLDVLPGMRLSLSSKS